MTLAPVPTAARSSSSGLHLAPTLTLPSEAVTQTFAVLAKRGAGKTYTALVLVEEFLKAGLQTVVVDPVGVTWGLRVAASGKGAGLPIVILGGDHGDLPLTSTAGELVADLVVDERLSAVLDLSLLRKGEQSRFVMDFAERLYHRNRAPVHLVLDEADAFAAQRPLPGQQRLLGAVEDLVRRGRARGLGVTLVTQRAAVLNKDVLTQVEVLVALRTIAPQDREAIDAWVRVHGTPAQRDELMASLPSLPIGTAWVWSPGWLDVFERVQVRPRETFDSSATPKVGQAPRPVAQPGAIDLDRVRTRLAALAEQAEAEDPRALRRRIAALEQQLRARPSAEPTPPRVERVEVPILDPAVAAQLGATARQLADIGTEIARVGNAIVEALARRPEHLLATAAAPAPAPTRAPGARPNPPRTDSNGKLPLAESKILAALAQYPQGRSKTQVALLTGYAVTGGGFGNALGALRSKGWIDGDKARLLITDAGLATIGPDWTPLPTGPALLDYWCVQLGRAERLILEQLVQVYPESMTKETLATATGYVASGGGFGNALGRLRTLELISGYSELRASDVFGERFGDPAHAS